MTLRQFLTVAAEISGRDLRPALALALKKEVPRSQQSDAGFYRRDIEELAASGALAESPEHARLTGVRRVRAVVVARGPAMTRTANTRGKQPFEPRANEFAGQRLTGRLLRHETALDLER